MTFNTLCKVSSGARPADLADHAVAASRSAAAGALAQHELREATAQLSRALGQFRLAR